MTMTIVGGNKVPLRSPGEPYDGLTVVVTQVESWGIHFLVPGHHHPKAVPGYEMRGRALWSEVVPVEDDRVRAAKVARERGYTGDVCATCGGCRMVRSGSCQRCEDCASTSGCS